MLTKTGRFALATAMLWLVFGGGGRAAAQIQPIQINTPYGLLPGAAFRIAFVTDGTTTATSTDINSYNNFVNTQAGGATYDGSVIKWTAIASTPTVNAIDNVGQTLTPVYLADGTLVTTSTTSTGLWSGTLLKPINEDLAGPTTSSPTWTGTDSNGLADAKFALGSPQALGYQLPYTYFGNSASYDPAWTMESYFDQETPYPMYGISQVLYVTSAAVPEPSTLWMAASVVCAAGAFRWFRRRRQHRR